MGPDSDGIGKVSHELRPICRVLFPPVMEEQVQPCAYTQDSEPALCLFGHKAHQQKVLYAPHDDSSVEERPDLACETSLMSLSYNVVVNFFYFWVAAIKSSNPFTIAVSAQPGFKCDPSTWNVSAPNAVSFGM